MLLLFENFHTVRWQRFIVFGLAVGFFFFYLLVLVVKIQNPFLLFNLTFPVAVAVVSRYGLLYGLFFNIVVTEVAAYSVKEKIGAFFVQFQMNNVVNYDLFILAHVAIVIITGVLFEERKRNERNLLQMIDEAVEKNRQQELLMLQQSRLAQMGETIGMIGHQWRQPLNGLALTVQIFAKKYRSGQVDQAYVEQFQAKSMRLIGHMSSTIDDFRKFFAPKKEKETFALTTVIEHALELVKPMFEKEGIEVVWEKHEDVMLFGYGNEIGQGIINILNNAKDAFSGNDTTYKKITISVRSDDAFVYLSIGDNAGGIPEAIAEKIFDPYFSTKDKNGTGLGLYMTKIIVEDHCGGRLSVANDADGAVFLMKLPVQAK